MALPSNKQASVGSRSKAPGIVNIIYLNRRGCVQRCRRHMEAPRQIRKKTANVPPLTPLTVYIMKKNKSDLIILNGVD